MPRRSDWFLAALGALSLAAPLRPAHADAPPVAPISDVVAKVKAAVVKVISVRPPKHDDDQPAPDVAQAAAERPTTAVGSGFIIGPAGFIATNKHVVENSIAVYVATADGIRYKATVVGTTMKADIALLRIDAGRQQLPTVAFGDSDKMRVGDTVIAIGSPFGFENSVSAGVISAVNRDIMESPFDDYLQTDAAINHGNSGGPLFNTQGEVIGMNSVLFGPGSGSVGLGFAIPSNDLRFVYDRMMGTGEVKAGMLPIRTQPVTWMIQQAIGTPNLEGALIAAVDDDGDKMMHGQIKPGDVILGFNGQKVWDPRDLARKAAWAPAGTDAALLISRAGVQQVVHVTIQAWPEGQSVPTSSANVKPHLGLELTAESHDGGPLAVTVAAVDPTGTAADSGLEKGDVILQIQQTPVSDPAQALRVLRVQSFTGHPYSSVLVERNKARSWVPIAVPD